MVHHVQARTRASLLGMLILVAGVIALTSTTSFAHAGTWTSSGSNVYYTGGNVGIGETSPSYDLHVKDSAAGSATALIQNTASSGSSYATLRFLTNNSGQDQYGIGLAPGYFRIRNVSNAEDVFIVYDTGAVEIGNSLILQAPSNGVHTVCNYNASEDCVGGFYIESDGSGSVSMKDETGDNTLRLRTNGDSFFNGGGVGIGTGTSSLTYSLEVAGDVNTTAGGYRDGGSCVAGTCASDRSLKHNIASIGDGMAKILQLNPVSFKYNDAQFGEGTQYGFIAQEVEDIFPELVTESDEGYKKVSYGLKFQMYAIAAIKDMWNTMWSKFNSQDARIDALEAEIAALKAELANE